MVKFHIIALKCGECGSYNTSRDGDVPVNAAVAAAVVAQNLEAEEGDIEENEDIEGGIEEDDGSEGTSDDITDNSDDDNASIGSDLSLD